MEHGPRSSPGSDSQAKQHRRARVNTQLKSAIREGLVPKARRSFALFTLAFFRKANSPEGMARNAAARRDTMRECAKQWKELDDTAVQHFKNLSAAEFAVQRAAVAMHSLRVRGRGYSSDEHDEKKKKLDALRALRPRRRLHVKTSAVGAMLPAPVTSLMSNWTSLGDFAVPHHHVQVLGQGAYGKVVQGVQLSSGIPVAVKLFGPGDVADFSRELANYNILHKSVAGKHHFLQLLGAATLESMMPWIALELAGPSLSKHLAKNGPLDAKRAASAALQLAQGLPGA